MPEIQQQLLAGFCPKLVLCLSPESHPCLICIMPRSGCLAYFVGDRIGLVRGEHGLMGFVRAWRPGIKWSKRAGRRSQTWALSRGCARAIACIASHCSPDRAVLSPCQRSGRIRPPAHGVEVCLNPWRSSDHGVLFYILYYTHFLNPCSFCLHCWGIPM